jgi:peptidoglycan/xylan/chitin deacetylase (PgdA/CDA1 family)
MKKLKFKLLRYLGLAKLFRFLFQRNKVSIVLLHDIDEKRADMIFNYLSNNYNIIDLNTYIQAHKSKDYSQIPKYAMIVTFDDGHKGNYRMLSALKKYNIPVTIFLCAGIINTKRHFWFMHKNSSIPISKLKRVPNKKRLELLKKDGFYQEQEYLQREALNKKEIDELSKYVNMQSHTLFHPILPMCSDEESLRELVKSKEILEKDYKFVINTISYPNGDYSDRDIALAKEAGYECGITVDFGFNTLESDIFRLKRVSLNDTDDMSELIVKASGLWAFIKSRNGKKQSYGYCKEPIREY